MQNLDPLACVTHSLVDYVTLTNSRCLCKPDEEFAVYAREFYRLVRAAHPIANKCFVVRPSIQNILSLVILLNTLSFFFVQRLELSHLTQ
jgi:hypothetical protein